MPQAVVTTDVTVCIASPQRQRQFAEPYSGLSVEELAEKYLPSGGGYTAALNGELVDAKRWATTIPVSGSSLIFVPDFGFLAALLSWAIPTIFGPTTAIGSSVFWTTVINVIGYVGASYLINSLMPKPRKPDDMGGAGGQNVWEPQTTQQEGLPIPRHYGVYRAHGNIIAAYTEPSDDYRHQLIYALIAFADGPIAACDAAEVRLANVPVGQYDDVDCETKRGLLVQTAPTHFASTRLQFRVNYELKLADGWWEFELPDDDYDDIEIDVRYDLWIRRESGKASTATAAIEIEIDEVGGGGWTTIWDESLTDYLTDLKWKKYTVSDEYVLTRGTRYKLRFRRTDQEGESDRHHNHVFVESIKEVIDVAFTYPGMVMAEIAGVASERFSGIMDVSALLEYRIVNAYDGAWALADDEDTAAWALWDLWTLPVISGDGGVTPYAIEEYLGLPPAQLDATDHYALALYGNGLVPDAEGGTEKRFSCNGIINSETTMWDAALRVCELARCLPIYNGNIIHLAINKSKTRSAMLSVGNIIKGSFEESFASIIDAAGEIEATFDDVDRDYEHRALPFANPNITTQQNKVTMDLWGLVKQTEVVRHIKFRLLQTQLRQRALLLSGDIDTLSLEVGDLVGIQEDVTDFGEMGTRGGGRVIAFEGGLSSALLAHWTLNDDAADTVVADSSGNSRHAVLAGGRNTEDLHVAGKVGTGAFNYNGAGDYVFDNDTFWDTIFTTGVPWSVSFWVQPAVDPALSELFIRKVQNPKYLDLFFRGDVNRWQAYLTDGTNTVYCIKTEADPSAAFHHFVATYDGFGGLKLYIDSIEGTKYTAGTGIPDYGSTGDLILGFSSYDGKLDAIQIFNRVLTADEVANLYNGGSGVEDFASQAVIVDQNLVDYILPATGYELCVRLAGAESDLTKTVDTVEAVLDHPDWCRVVIVEPFLAGAVPQRGDLWAMGKTDIVLKDFTIEAIEQTGRLQRKLTLLEYDAACYDGDDEIPIVPVPTATPARTDRNLLAPPTPRHIATQAPSSAMEFPTIDAGISTNITWTSDDPGAGSVSWSATDPAEPLLFTWRGVDYEITASNTALQFVYFDSTVTDFVATDTFADCFGANKIPVCVNNDGEAVPYLGLGAFHAALITNLSVATLKIADNAVTVPVSAYTAGNGTTGDVQTVSVESTGAPIFIIGGLVARQYFDTTGLKDYRLRIVREHATLIVDLEAYYKLDDNLSNTVVLDASANDRSAVLAGGRTTQDLNTAGVIDDAFDYNGAGDYVVDDDADWDAIFTDGIPWSVAFWCQPASNAKDSYFVNKSSGAKHLQIGWLNATDEWTALLDDGVNSVYVTKSQADPTAAWHQVIVTYDGAGDLQMYIDNVAGTQGETGTGVPDFGTTADWIMGTDSYEGKLDAMMIWSRVVTSAERAALYNSGSGHDVIHVVYDTGGCTHLVVTTGYYNFPITCCNEDTPPQDEYNYNLRWSGDFNCKERVLYAIQTKK